MISPNSKGEHFQRYIQYTSAIISAYSNDEPFHVYLKKYFSANKKHGSRDRKWIASLCYDFFRLGNGVSADVDFKQKLLIAFFLCEKDPSPFLAFLKPEWNSLIQLSLNEKIEFVKREFDPTKTFPFVTKLSSAISVDKFSCSFLIQPKLFIRNRPGSREKVAGKLKLSGILFEKVSDDCFAFKNNEKVSDVLDIDKECVIQDYNSQRIAEFLKVANDKLRLPVIAIWDCCAASGGKSILAFDFFERIKLTVSDNRKSILENLFKRFKKAGLKNYDSFIADLTSPVPLKKFFDLIIADVPCSGSGTWARTPEWLTFFNRNEINRYSLLQKKIIENTIPGLKPGGYYLYVTCSVFIKENEENVEFIQENFSLKLIKMEYLKGYEMQADTLFAALFTK